LEQRDDFLGVHLIEIVRNLEFAVHEPDATCGDRPAGQGLVRLRPEAYTPAQSFWLR
jgi:hypothetical protein